MLYRRRHSAHKATGRSASDCGRDIGFCRRWTKDISDRCSWCLTALSRFASKPPIDHPLLRTHTVGEGHTHCLSSLTYLQTRPMDCRIKSGNDENVMSLIQRRALKHTRLPS